LLSPVYYLTLQKYKKKAITHKLTPFSLSFIKKICIFAPNSRQNAQQMKEILNKHKTQNKA
jgi:hypothetical protein